MKKVSLFFVFVLFCISVSGQKKIKQGIDLLVDKYSGMLEGKRIALITNHTGLNSELVSAIDILKRNFNLVKLFAPEHGVRGEYYSGEYVPSYIDEITGLTVHSLYGNTKKPSYDQIEDIDVLVYDIQDIGTRAYTYIYTMSYCMEAAAEYNKEFIVLDRPNPLSGNIIDGNVLEQEFSSFIGRYPIPYIYGLTVGELAELFNIEFGINCNLKVIKMEGWKRNMFFEDTGLNWIPTSPHIPYKESALYCAITGIIGELGIVCEGVGYTLPFQLIGAPWINGYVLSEKLNSYNLKGLIFIPSFFKPYYGRFKGEKCSGVKIIITDKKKIKPFKAGLIILYSLQQVYSDKNIFNKDRLKMFHYAMGTDKITEMIKSGKPVEEIIKWYESQLDDFRKVRKKYLIYRD